MRDEERADRVEANLNVHLQSYAKNVGNIQHNFKRVVEKINVCDDRVDVLQRRQNNQEAFNHAILVRMQEMEAKAEVQEERIVTLEEEVATLHWKKACACGEEGKETVIATGSGEDNTLELEYVEEGEEVSSGSSYHSLTVAQEEPLLISGSSSMEEVPILHSIPCGCPALATRIEDNVEMVAAPQENTTPIPVRVEEPPRYNVGVPHASCGCPQAYFHSSTRHRNRHAKQLGVCPYPQLEFFLEQDIRFVCTRELRTAVQRSERGGDKDGTRVVAGQAVNSSDVPEDADGRSSVSSPSYSDGSTRYCPCSADCC